MIFSRTGGLKLSENVSPIDDIISKLYVTSAHKERALIGRIKMNRKFWATCVTATALAMSISAAAAKDSYRVAVIRWEPNDIYFDGVQLGQEQEKARIEAADKVKIEFTVFGANDATQRRNALDAQLAAGVDGVLLVPWRGESMIKVLND